MVELNLELKTVAASSLFNSGPCRYRSLNKAAFPDRAISTGPIAVRAKKGVTGGCPGWETTRELSLILPADTKPLDNALVTRLITHLDIVEQLAALTNQLQQTPA